MFTSCICNTSKRQPKRCTIIVCQRRKLSGETRSRKRCLILRLGGSANRAIVYLKNALPDVAPIAEGAIMAALKDGVDGRHFRGLAKEGPIFLALNELPKGDEPTFAVILAVTDYKAFRDGILKD